MQIISNTGTIYTVNKYINSDGEESVWCNEWYGRHRIGVDCEWVKPEVLSKEESFKKYLHFVNTALTMMPLTIRDHWEAGYIAGAAEYQQLKEGAEKIRLALVMAVFALKLSYDVTEHPADGKTEQDSAIRIGDEALNAWREGKEVRNES